MYQTLSIINKGHIFMNFDGMILTFYIWICVVHCVHQDKCLKTLQWRVFTTSSDIKHDFINSYYIWFVLYRAPNNLMLAPRGRDAWCLVVSQGDHIKYIVVITVYFEVYCMYKSYFARGFSLRAKVRIFTHSDTKVPLQLLCLPC